ncbi:MAG: SusC/RagA family TonB-linked outer membrane protein [Bacteroidota bacterium]
MQTNYLRGKIFVASMLILFIRLSSVSAANAQAEINIHLEEVPIVEVFNEISKQTGYTFFFKDGEIDLNRQVTIFSEDEDIVSVLEILFSGTNIKYDILKNQIVLTQDATESEVIPNTYVNGQQQQVPITGRVTSSEDGLGLPGVTIVIVGTPNGTVTDSEGYYSIMAKKEDRLRFSFIGFSTKIAVVSSNVFNVVLDPDATALDEVVVVALGISREKKALGYSVSELGGEEVNNVPTTDIINNLSGKIPGLQVSSSSGNMGGSSRVLIRGASSMLGNNQPLYVVDGTVIDNSSMSNIMQNAGLGDVADYGNMSQDINPDDIESVSVLKGPAASALYGSRAANGVIIITTKRGEKSENIGVDVNLTGMFENVSRLPQYQNEYGGGLGNSFDQIDIDGTSYNTPYYAMDQSWGPKLDGTMVIPWWSVYDWEANGKNGVPETVPWVAQPSNIRDFFETGFLAKTNIAFYGGNDKADFRLSYTNFNQTGVYPNSRLGRNTINFSGNLNLTSKLFVGVSGSYINNLSRALPVSGYSNNAIMTKFAQWGQRQWDMNKMKDYKQPDGTHRTWNRISFNDPSPQYADNPYWTQYENFGESERDRVFGNTKVGYKFTDWLTGQIKVNMDHYNEKRSVKTAEGSTLESWYAMDVFGLTELNKEISFIFQKQLNEEFNVSGTFGANRMDRKYQRVSGSTDGGLAVPGIYSLNNSTNQAFVDEYIYNKRINSAYGNISLGWRSMLYVDGLLRNDWSSTLPEDNNSYLYYSTSVSFILSEIASLKNAAWLDFLKLRGGYAKVGNDTDPYNLESIYINHNSYGNKPMFSNPNALFNSDLKPETTNSWETGLEMNMFRNRIAAIFTYYSTITVDQIMPVPISATSGFRTRWHNAGSMSNNGVEAGVTITPVQNDNFSWDITGNFSKNINRVVELHSDIDQIKLADVNGTYLVAAENEMYGMLKGTDFVYIDGHKVVVDGLYKQSAELKSLGSVIPDYNAGIINNMHYKGINFGFTIDHQKGGHFLSLTNMYGMASGSFQGTVDGGIRENGIILPGVKEDGTPNDVSVSAYDWGNSHRNFGALNVFEATYWKLREIHLGYSLPVKYTGPFQGVRISLIGKNLALWGTDNPHIDPEQITNGGNVQGFEGGANPPTRSFGFNVSIKL